MASTNKTENLGLSQFLAADKPSWLVDYNNDMQKIDEAIENAHYAKNTKLEGYVKPATASAIKNGDSVQTALEKMDAKSIKTNSPLWTGEMTTGSISASKDVGQISQLLWANIEWIYCIGIRISNNVYFYGLSPVPSEGSQQVLSANFSINGNVWTLEGSSNIRLHGGKVAEKKSAPKIRVIGEISLG